MPVWLAYVARYDISRRRWRHLDLGAQALWLEADIARIDCRVCGRVRTEDVPWARPGARCSRDVEDTIDWLAQRMDKSAIAVLMRCAWRTVDTAVKRLVTEHLDTDVNHARLEGLVRIGVDEISYKRGHSYLTVIADHDTGRVVWVSKGRSLEAFEEFTTALGPQRCAQVEAITMDMFHIYRGAAARWLPNARVCFDPFHVIKWTNEALERVLDTVRAALRPVTPERTNASPSAANLTDRGLRRTQEQIDADMQNQDRNWLFEASTGRPSRKSWRNARFLLRAGAERLSSPQRDVLKRLRDEDLTLARAWELKEGLRGLYRLSRPGRARRYLRAWCKAATNSGIGAFITLARRIHKHFDGIIAAVDLGLSNSRLEGLNSKIRVIQRRGFGHHPDPLRAMIHLCLGGIEVSLPTQR